jgi:glycosyltransferase 2 family protein
MSAAPAEPTPRPTPEPELKSSFGSTWKVMLRIAVAVALLAFLATKIRNPDDLVPSEHHALTAALLGLALLTAFVGIVLSAWRWQRVLLLFDAHVPLRTLTAHYFAGQFVSSALPSTIGGDVLRVSRASATVDSPTVAFASVVLERLTGFVALPLLVLIGFALEPSLLDEQHAWVALLVAGVTLGILSLVLFVAGHPRIAGRFAGHENWTRFIGAVHLGVDRLRREPRQIFPILGTAMTYQISVILSFGLIFRALDLPVPVAAVIAFVPAVAMLQVLPLTFAGLGVREGALVLFLHPLGVSNAQAFAAGVLWYLTLLVASLPGAPAFAVGHRGRAADERARRGRVSEERQS